MYEILYFATIAGGVIAGILVLVGLGAAAWPQIQSFLP